MSAIEGQLLDGPTVQPLADDLVDAVDRHHEHRRAGTVHEAHRQDARGGWEFLDVMDCYVNGDSCYGNNPASPYVYPLFKDFVRLKLGPSEAVVLFMRTPPEARY